MTHQVVGKGLPRVDGVEKATGKAVFTADVYPPGVLYGKILRSPHPHARIRGIDTSKAERLPGVVYVLTGKEVAHVRYAFVDTPRYPADEQPLAVDKVRYIGDEVAAVVAETEEIAEEALRLIEVDYEVLPAVFDPEEAMKPEAPEIHERPQGGTSAWEQWGVAKGGRRVGGEEKYKNVSGHTLVSFGDVEEGFRQAYYVRQDRFYCAPTAHCAMEPHVAVASYDPLTGQLDLWLSTQGIFLKRDVLSRALGLPHSRIRVRHTYCGGAFGGKIDVFPYEFCAAYLAMRLGRPVRFELSREEVFMTTRQRHPVIIDVKTGVDREGRILAQDIRFIADNGGYRGTGAVVVFLGHAFSFPIYNVPNYRYEGIAVYTNNPIRGPQRGHGAPQIRFAIDSQLDMIARDLGLDTVDVMLKNIRHKGDVLPNGDVLKSCGLEEAIRQAAAAMGWSEKRGRKQEGRYRYGIGISLCSMFSGAMYYPFASAAMVKLHDDGSVTLYTGAQEIGQGIYTTLAQVVAEELGLCLEDVRVVAGDTELCPIDLGSFLSNGALVSGNAARLAALDAKRQLFDVAAELLQCTPGELELKNKTIFVRTQPERSLSLSQVIQQSVLRRSGNPIIGHGSFKGHPDTDRYPSLASGKGLFTPAYGFAAQVAEVRVDTQTGEVRLVRAATFHDCGYPLNKQVVEGQVEGCASMGQGQALSEEVIIKEGLVLNPSFLEYKLPLATETPERVDGIVQTHEPTGPFGAKEVGEGSVAGMLAAVANAVADAVGVRVTSLPITPAKVLAALQASQQGST